MSGFLVPRVLQHKKNRRKDSATRSACLPELDGRPWLLSTATVRLLILPPHQKSGRSVQGDSTAGSDPPAAESPPSPPHGAEGKPGGGPRARFQPGGAGPSEGVPPSQAGTQESVATRFSFPLPLACDPQAGVRDLRAGKGSLSPLKRPLQEE